jgi:hypothetical protein
MRIFAALNHLSLIMTPFVHKIYLSSLSGIVIFTAAFLLYKGLPYYATPVEERFYHPDHNWFKPSGIFGHGLGIVGTLLIVIGVFGYMARKKYRSLARLGRLKYWLEFHIFLCSLGPVMILFHTAFKFGGLVSVSFWSMVAVVASGVIGRFIYLQIPRSIEGRALSLNEIQAMKGNLETSLEKLSHLQAEGRTHILSTILAADARTASGGMISQYMEDGRKKRKVAQLLSNYQLAREDRKHIMAIVNNEIQLGRRIERLQTMQKLFKYWHVAHLPFALIMLIIMVIHVGITLAFGYRWVF